MATIALPGQMDMFAETALPVLEANPKPMTSTKVRIDRSLKGGAMVGVQAHIRVSEDFMASRLIDGGNITQVSPTDFILEDDDAVTIPRRRTASPGGTLAQAGDATMDYLQAQLAASFQATIGDDARMAMALVVASTLSYRGPLPPLSVAGTGLDTDQRTSAPCLMLKEHHQELQTIMAAAGITVFHTPAQLLVALMAMDINDLDVVFAHVVARSAVLGWDRKAVEMIAATGRAPMDEWRIEPSYLATLSTAQVKELGCQLQDKSEGPHQVKQSASREAFEKWILQWAAVDGNVWFPPQLAEFVEGAA